MFVFFFGKNIYKYSSKRPNTITCHNCKVKEHTCINRYLKYWHFWYIPIFPYKFWTEYNCVRCRSIENENELPSEIKHLYKQFKTKKLLPIWPFSGLITALIIALIFLIMSINNKQEILSKIDRLEINQKFDYKTENGKYSIFKIYEIDKESIGLVYNNFQTNTENNLVNIDYKSNYTNDTIISTITELKAWVKSGKVISIYK